MKPLYIPTNLLSSYLAVDIGFRHNLLSACSFIRDLVLTHDLLNQLTASKRLSLVGDNSIQAGDHGLNPLVTIGHYVDSNERLYSTQ